ncbi:hypothetical protein [Tahibacter amnicola]|uniref:Uncharacterized protein n=1 Tax=Tahibacter amnicola TaxID=2976241 RepID=A0ABY6BCD7_9GAMM|nr:hypothetical protein [Tahibacter amnicola]UXI65980.1 hypothetical protein N4264_14575 [Tahibacter amnicola]
MSGKLGQDHPQLIPPAFNFSETQADLKAWDDLRPRLARLQRLMDRADDTMIAIGSDLMTASLEGYALLKVVGKDQGLKSLRRDLSSRFRKNGSVVAESDEPVEA